MFPFDWPFKNNTRVLVPSYGIGVINITEYEAEPEFLPDWDWDLAFQEILKHPLKEWNTLKVVYEKPLVHRLWRPFREGRIMLHKIFPGEGTSLYHPHPWPSKMKILRGSYKMNFGYEERIHTRLKLSAGSTYEMTDPYLYHDVTVERDPVYSIMVTGLPYPDSSPYARAVKDGRLSFPLEKQPELSHDEAFRQYEDFWHLARSSV